jgi:hypothetical protein
MRILIESSAEARPSQGSRDVSTMAAKRTPVAVPTVVRASHPSSDFQEAEWEAPAPSLAEGRGSGPSHSATISNVSSP